MGLRNRIDFPFDPTNPINFSGPITFSAPVTFNSTVTYGAASVVTFNSSATVTFTNSATFGSIITNQIYSPGNLGLPYFNYTSAGAGALLTFNATAFRGATNDFTIHNQATGHDLLTVPTGTDNLVANLGIQPGPAQSKLTIYQENVAFTPNPNAFTIVNGTGAVTFSGLYTQIGKFVHAEIKATLTGTATLACTFLTGSFNALPWTTESSGVANHATDGNGTNYGHGLTTGTAWFPPTIAATHGSGYIVFSTDMCVQ